MKKVQLIVLLLSILIPAMSFAQHRESRKAKIARLERENAALAAQSNVYQSELEKARHLSDSIANVNSTNAARLAVAVEQNEDLQNQNRQLQAQNDSLTQVNAQLTAEINRQLAIQKAKNKPKPVPTYLTPRCEEVCKGLFYGCESWVKDAKAGDPSFQIVDVSVLHTDYSGDVTQWYTQIVTFEYMIKGQKFTKQFKNRLREGFVGWVD